MSPRSFSAQCFRSVSPLSVSAHCLRSVSPLSISAQCLCDVSPRRVSATCLRDVSPLSVSAQCLRAVSPRRVSAPCLRLQRVVELIVVGAVVAAALELILIVLKMPVSLGSSLLSCTPADGIQSWATMFYPQSLWVIEVVCSLCSCPKCSEVCSYEELATLRPRVSTGRSQIPF